MFLHRTELCIQFTVGTQGCEQDPKRYYTAIQKMIWDHKMSVESPVVLYGLPTRSLVLAPSGSNFMEVVICVWCFFAGHLPFLLFETKL